MLSRMSRLTLTVLPVVALSLACSQQKPAPFEPEQQTVRDDREAPFNPPERYPEWAFDQPEYLRPAKPETPAPAARPNDPQHFFTNKRVVMVEQPGGYTPEETPRIAIYYTNDNGFHWKKAGYFGREQSYFPLETDNDGDYGVNFVGPGQKPEEQTPAYPARMYHVDTMLPEVTVNIDPEKTWYAVGEDIRISWEAKDPHLEQFPVRIGMLMDFTASSHDLIELQRDLPDDGSIDYHISSETEGHEIVFRVEALDRAGNLGLAYSHALQIKEHSDDQIVAKAAHHHDDRIRTARRKVPAMTTPSSKPTLTMKSPANTSKPETTTGAAAPTPAAPKTRVKVITLGQSDSNNAESKATPMMTTTPQPASNDNTEVTPMSAAPATTHDDDIATLLNCEERETYEKAIAPEPIEDEPVANAEAAHHKTAPNANAKSIQETLAPLREAIISRIEDIKRSAPKPSTTAKPTPVAADTTAKPLPTPKAVASPRPVAQAAPKARKSHGGNTARPIASMPNLPTSTMRGAELVAPMPGTIAQPTTTNELSHPWRSLGANQATASTQTWALPEAKAAVSAEPTVEPRQPNGPVLVEVREPDELPAD